jgi:exodeoxyribonuclease-3
MRIITANVNGIRAAEKKGFFQWMKKQKPDVVCLQETKAQEDQLLLKDFYPKGYHCYYFDAEKKGYSGVAIYSRHKPSKVTRGLGKGFEDMDAEGRFVQVDFDSEETGKLSIVSLYLPSGSAKEERQQVKYSFMDRFTETLKKMRRQRVVYRRNVPGWINYLGR